MINTAPIYLIDQLRNLPPDKSLCSDSFYAETDHESKLFQSGKMDDTQGGLCLASLLASHPGLRPWSGDMGGYCYRSCWHFYESCLSRNDLPYSMCVKFNRDKLQSVLCVI